MSDFNSLADDYAILKSKIELYEEALKKLRAEILATGQEKIIGERAIVEVSLSERNALDTKAVKKVLTAEQIASFTKTSLVETLRIKPRV